MAGMSLQLKLSLIGLALATLLVASLNFLHFSNTQQLRHEIDHLRNELQRSKGLSNSASLAVGSITKPGRPTSQFKAKVSSINSFWWPSAEQGGLLAKIHAVQNPKDCSSPSTRYFVWRSVSKNRDDHRGISAWGHTAMWQLLHALTDGDRFDKFGGRVLIQDEELWPMAKGCKHGPETRECYFEPLTHCKLSDVDPMNSKDKAKSYTLSKHDEEYDRSVRTLYSTDKFWFRSTSDAFAWTGLYGTERYHLHPEISMVAASFAFYFNPKPWLKNEIHERLQKSIPADLDPDRTIGVPIRRSDKCSGHDLKGSAGGEMACHPLETYLDGVKRFIKFDPLIENVIITSEDKSACDEFIALVKKVLPRLRVVVNVGDVQQGTGSASKLESYTEGATNAAVIASALTSLHMHMRARYFVITSKSTWTSTLTLIARVYGFATSEVFVVDLEEKLNRLAELAKSGCYIACEPHAKCTDTINRKNSWKSWGLAKGGVNAGS